MGGRREELTERDFRPKGRRPLIIAIVLNCLVALVFLGGPYVRGRLRAADARERFSRFGACFWGGEPAEQPGLGLPEGQRIRYAERVVHGPDDWPARCKDDLERIIPARAVLLFPAVKHAEGQARRAVKLVERELARLKSGGRGPDMAEVPVRPLRAARRLIAALSKLSKAAGLDPGADRPALEFAGDVPLVTPTRIPLGVAEGADLQIRARGTGMQAMAVGRNRIARIDVGGGGMVEQRIQRPGLVRGVLRGEADGWWLVWAMGESRCEDEPKRCAHHSTGLAQLTEDTDHAPEPLWLASHPEGPVARSVAVARNGTLLVARTPEGAELRRFPRPTTRGEGADVARKDNEEDGDDAEGKDAEGKDAGGEEESKPVLPGGSWVLKGYRPGDTATLFHPGFSQQPWIAWTSRDDESASETASSGEGSRDEGDGGEASTPAVVLHARPATPGAEQEPEGAFSIRVPKAGPSSPWLVTCTSSNGFWLAGGGHRALRLAHVRDGGQEVLARQAVGPESHSARRPDGGDGVRIVCEQDGADLVLREGSEGPLRALRCEPGAECQQTAPLAPEAAFFDAAREDGTTLVAFSSGGHMRVRPLGRDGARVPAPCWSDGRGLCGPPVMAARNRRFVLGGREGADLLTVESIDAGHAWRPMRGLK